MDNTTAMAATVGLTIVGLVVLVYYITLIFFCASLHKTMKRVPKDKRVFPNAFIWLFLVPFFQIVFQWLMLPFGIPHGLRNAVSGSEEAVRSAAGIKGLGLTILILLTLIFFLSFLIQFEAHPTQPVAHSVWLNVIVISNFFLWLASFILWVIYWVKVVAFRNKYLKV